MQVEVATPRHHSKAICQDLPYALQHFFLLSKCPEILTFAKLYFVLANTDGGALLLKAESWALLLPVMQTIRIHRVHWSPLLAAYLS